MVGFLLHVCVNSWVNEVVIWAMVTQFIVLIFLWARFHVALGLTPLRFEALERMNRSLTKIVIWSFSVWRSAIPLAKVCGEIALALDCLQVPTSLIWTCLTDAGPFSLQPSQVEPLVLAWVTKWSTVEWLFLFLSERVTLVASSDAWISCRVGPFLLPTVIHAAAWS